MEDLISVGIPVVSIFIGLPWLIFHYVTKWKQAPRITDEDEKLLDDLHYTARRLEDRLQTIERIIAADDPDFGRLTSSVAETGYELPRRN